MAEDNKKFPKLRNFSKFVQTFVTIIKTEDRVER